MLVNKPESDIECNYQRWCIILKNLVLSIKIKKKAERISYEGKSKSI